jgi:hypothetical protein
MKHRCLGCEDVQGCRPTRAKRGFCPGGGKRMRISLLAVAVLVLAGCAATGRGLDTTKPALGTVGFRPNEMERSYDCTGCNSKTLSGTDIGTGLSYSYDSASIEGSVWRQNVAIEDRDKPLEWTVKCKRDEISDAETCSLRASKGFSTTIIDSVLLISLTKNLNTTRMCISKHDFPGVTAFIRVDDRVPVETDTSGCVGAKAAGALQGQIREARAITIRRTEWPYRTPITQTYRVEQSLDLAEDLLGFLTRR